MKIYITRHGQTDWNLERKVCGRAEAQLTELGRQQAAQLAEQVAATNVSLILASPLARARDTARIVANRTGLPVMLEPRLVEQDFGTYEGRSVEDGEYRSNRENLFFRFPGGETTAQLIYRGYTVLEDVKRKYRDRSVLLVTHGCLCRALRSYFEEIPPNGFYDFYMNNCQLLEYDG